ncbi:MAG: HlyD family efflux transporter periplasmic adaptor subunit [Vicinamibacterales bacterium]
MMSILRLLTNRRVLITAGLAAALLAVALWPKTVAVDVAVVSSGPLVVTIDEEGRTRVRDRFVVATPVAGRVLRVELDAGDPVKRGQVVARVRAEAPPLLDARARAEAQAAIDGAEAALGRARADEARARAALAQAQREGLRTRTLVAEQLGTSQALEAREAEVRASEEAVNAAAFAVRAAASELDRARVRIAPASSDVSGRVVDVTAPVDGVVLKRLRESESVVPAGDPLLEIGDPGRLEIVADLLSTDAVRVRAGARVMLEQWGGDHALAATVRRVEPAGFTKISALGVEEQRVNVIMDVASPADTFAALGDGYRVEVRIVVWEEPRTLKVPTSALFRVGDQWAVYVPVQGRAHRTLLELGHQTGQEAEVLSGLAEGASVIVHPGDTVVEGVRVTERPR